MKKDFDISLLCQEELEGAVALAVRVFGPVLEERARETFSRNPDGSPEQPVTFAARHEGKIAGLVWCAEAPVNFDIYTFGWVSVDPALRGQGIGKALVRHAERYIAEDLLKGRPGTIIITDDTENPSSGYYAKLGYASGPPIHGGPPVMVKIITAEPVPARR